MFILCFLLLQAEAPAPPLNQEIWAPWLHGSLSVRYRHRRTSDAEDSDLYQVLQLRAEGDVVSAALSVRFAEDLDRPSTTPGYHPFDSLDDTYGTRTARLYTAYVDVRTAGLLIRGGRQILEELPEALPFDGGLLRAATEDVEAAVFAGIPVNLFESSPEGDLTYGGWAGVRPWRRAQVRAEYLHLEDENVFGMFDDDLLGATFEQGSGPFLFSGRHTWLEGEGRDAVARLSAAFRDIGFLFNVRARYAYERQQALSFAIDPFATFLFEVEPHLDLTARASQAIGRHLVVDASATERRFVRGGQEGTYNHEFTRWSVGPRLTFEGLSFAAALDFWDSTQDEFWTSTGDVAWEFHPGLVAAVGSGYALYVVDVLTGEERERVRTYSASLRWTLEAATRLDLRFTLEENELGSWRVLEVGIRHAF